MTVHVDSADRHPSELALPTLHQLVNDPAALRAALDAGASVDERAGYEESTPLHWAAKTGEPDVVQLLLQHGANIDAADRSGRTPLAWARSRDDSAGGRRPVIRLLLARGASHTFDFAIAKGDGEHVAAWLTRGTSPGAQLADGGSALALAAAVGDPGVADVLLAAGANARGEAFDVESPLLRAVRAARPEIVEILLRAGADPGRGGPGGALPLDDAAPHASPGARAIACGALLVAHGARPTPQWAVVQAAPELLRAAMAAGWPVDRRDANDRTALMLAANATSPRMTEALLACGADPRLANSFGTTALHAAAGELHGEPGVDVVRMLLAAGADPNARDRDGRTPLHQALRLLHTLGVILPVVSLLAAGGADPHIRDGQGCTPLEVDAGMPMHHDVASDDAEAAATVARRDAAVREVERILGV